MDKRSKILIVGYEDHQRELFRLELTERAYKVIDASSGKEALRILGKMADIDVVLLDWILPNEDSCRIMKKIREGFSDLPVVIHTAYPIKKEQCRTLGAKACAIKSSRLDDLVRIVEGIIQEKSQHQNVGINE